MNIKEWLTEHKNKKEITIVDGQLWWTCECCGKPVPYPYIFCSKCGEKLLEEPPKPIEPIDPPEREEIRNDI